MRRVNIVNRAKATLMALDPQNTAQIRERELQCPTPVNPWRSEEKPKERRILGGLDDERVLEINHAVSQCSVLPPLR